MVMKGAEIACLSDHSLRFQVGYYFMMSPTIFWSKIRIYVILAHHLELKEPKTLNSWNNDFWLKFDDEMWSRIFHFEIELAPPELLLPSAKNWPRKAELAWQVSRYIWRPPWNFKIIFSRPLFTIRFKPKMVSNLCKNFFCIAWH